MIHLNLFCWKCQEEHHFLKDEQKPDSIKCEICGTMLGSFSPINGYVYVLSNPCMPNLVKIGFTRRNIDIRLAELNSSTGVPESFVLEAAFSSVSPERDEQVVHSKLSDHRTNKNREFFQIEVLEAITKIKNIFEKPPDYIGINGKAENERIRKLEEERIVEQKRTVLLSEGIYADDPGSEIACYSLLCLNCQTRFYSKYPKNNKSACPLCFSYKIK
jgi:hypothetical protein